MKTLALGLMAGIAALAGCSRGAVDVSGGNAPVASDTGSDAGSGGTTTGAGTPDAGTGGTSVDAGSGDAGLDGGSGDAGLDAGSPDAGTDGGSLSTGTAGGKPDAGPTVETGSVGPTGMAPTPFGTPGPWPVANQTWGAANGILERPVVGTSTDEAQNLWVATPKALYLLKPGENTFHRFDGRDGLHLQGFPVGYCDTWAPGKECPIWGSAADPGIMEIVGGEAGEVFVGYAGYHDWSSPTDGLWTDPYRHTGKLDRVRLTANGTLEVVRFDMVAGNSYEFWHNRTVLKMVYDHFTHPHELYVGTDHGVDKFSPRLWHPTDPNYSFNDSQNNLMWMSDHLHPQVCYHHPCDNSEADLRLGDWRGLALTSAGDLWVAGHWAAGLIRYTADNSVWYARGGNAYLAAFGDPYSGNCVGNRPVFCTPLEGDNVNLSAVAVAKDGTVWFASGPDHIGTSDPAYGLAAWDGAGFTYYDPMRNAGMAEASVRDMVALPDGRLALAGPNTGLVLWDPKSGSSKAIRAGSGIPDDHVFRLELDTMVNPPALHVSTYLGAASLRVLP